MSVDLPPDKCLMWNNTCVSDACPPSSRGASSLIQSACLTEVFWLQPPRLKSLWLSRSQPSLTFQVANKKQRKALKWEFPLSPTFAIFPEPKPGELLGHHIMQAMIILIQPYNRQLQFLIAQLTALASHHTVGWVNAKKLTADDMLESHTFVFASPI